jgi:hypothetical protein
METEILRSILRRQGLPELVDVLAERLGASEFNTLLLEVMRRRAEARTPAQLLRAYVENRFVQPGEVDPIGFAEFALAWQRAARAAGFTPQLLSPVAPLGACSVVGTVHQDKVLSALRATEVVADATNVLALESSRLRRAAGFPAEPLRFSTVHRHVRTQVVDLPGYAAHFSILVLTAAGRDTGDFGFETAQLVEQLRFYDRALRDVAGLPVAAVRLKRLAGDGRAFDAMHAAVQATAPDWGVEVLTGRPDEAYYRHLQFKVVVDVPGRGLLEIADGGLVDWTQRLTGNRKERFLISGLGIELLFKFGCRGE